MEATTPPLATSGEQPQLALAQRPWSTTVVMSLAAACAALIAIFGSSASISGITIAFALIGLVPWALESGGVQLRPPLFAVLTIAPAAVIVLADRNPGGLFPAMIAVVAITHRRCSSVVRVACLASVVGLTVGLTVLEGARSTGGVYFLGGIGVSWLAGSMLRRQEALVAELRQAAERERRHAAAEERARIAREVHDVVAHSLTVTMLHVTGARRAISTNPERAAEALERAETVGRESLDSIRQVVGLLRDSVTGADASGGSRDPVADAPLPQLSDIPALVAQYRTAGLCVAASVDIDGIAADATTSLTAFRVVQEALSNALQHAPGAPVELHVAGDGHGTVLRIVAENPAPTRARTSGRQGLGLLGMTERVRAAGGSVDVGPADSGAWRIEAALPLRRSAALS
ncbi:MAG: hypothetical protein F2534_19415 [Actinobacteria bacterium]|nr:hypothetical protein [Actinomycetota bacterium]